MITRYNPHAQTKIALSFQFTNSSMLTSKCKMKEAAISSNYHQNISLELLKMTNKTIFTLVFVKKNSEVLLGLKTRGFGVGLWNGFGGKVEPKENICEGARRELKEESNLEAPEMRHLGVVTYEKENSPYTSVVHVFTASSFNGIIKTSEEMNPIRWYNYKDIPYHSMWPDAKLWYPMMLGENYFSALIKYGTDGKIKEKNIKQHRDVQDILKENSM